MKIIRDGKEIELTLEEVALAYEEHVKDWMAGILKKNCNFDEGEDEDELEPWVEYLYGACSGNGCCVDEEYGSVEKGFINFMEKCKIEKAQEEQNK